MSTPTQADIEIVGEFCAETRENMDQMERDLVSWEKQPATREALDRIFRSVHTLKGTCGFLGYKRLENIAHQSESLLTRLRDGTLDVSPAVITVLLKVLDLVRRFLEQIEKTGEEGELSHDALLSEIKRLRDLESNAVAAQNEKVVKETMADATTESTIRVEVALLDRLMNLVGELVLSRNQIFRMSLTGHDSALAGVSQRLSLITSELQEGVMKTRLQPIGNSWNRFPRLVRDAAVTSGKKIRLHMTGQETETDKSIIEAVKDPMAHLVRNCIDHGIEIPARRRKSGKPEEGQITIRAYHEGSQVIVEIGDDGTGIRTELIKEAALRRGDITPDQAAAMSERELHHLIFLPGFSTAREVTMLSGRGVGMDVVKINLDRIGGTVDVISQPGEGTMFKMKIPLTLAIIPALMIHTGGERFAIPQVNLRKLLCLRDDGKDGRVEWVSGAPVYRLQGRLLPLVYLRQELGFPPRSDAGQSADEAVNIVVLQSQEGSFGLVVDEVEDTEEIVVKPLGKHLKTVPVFSGATILGDGKVALILDVMTISEKLRLRNRGAVLREESPTVPVAPDEGTVEELLLFQVAERGCLAIPLSEVVRLEEFPAESVEMEGPGEAVQYKGEIMPLLPLRQLLLPDAPLVEGASSSVPVIVCAHQGTYCGLRVSQILDVVREPLTLQRRHVRPGVMGSAVIQGKVTELIDLSELIAMGTRRMAEADLSGTEGA